MAQDTDAIERTVERSLNQAVSQDLRALYNMPPPPMLGQGIGQLVGGEIATTMDAAAYETRIQRVGNGWIVKVGCQTFVSTDWNEISMGLKEFYDDPKKAYEKWVVKKENANV